MSTIYEKPVRGKGGSYEHFTESHPAYALVGAYRVSSSGGPHNGQALFGSDFVHRDFMVVRLQHAAVSRNTTGHDHHHSISAPLIVEFAMSLAQWVTLISSPNMGDGVPCTLEVLEGARLPAIMPISNRRVQFNAEVGERLEATLVSMREALALATTKKQRQPIEQAIQNLESNLSYAAETFDKFAETTVERAKVEVAAYIQGAIERAGMVAIGFTPEPIRLIESGDET